MIAWPIELISALPTRRDVMRLCVSVTVPDWGLCIVYVKHDVITLPRMTTVHIDDTINIYGVIYLIIDRNKSPISSHDPGDDYQYDTGVDCISIYLFIKKDDKYPFTIPHIHRLLLPVTVI